MYVPSRSYARRSKKRKQKLGLRVTLSDWLMNIDMMNWFAQAICSGVVTNKAQLNNRNPKNKRKKWDETPVRFLLMVKTIRNIINSGQQPITLYSCLPLPLEYRKRNREENDEKNKTNTYRTRHLNQEPSIQKKGVVSSPPPKQNASLYLVLNKGDERGEYDRQPRAAARWELIAERFASPRRHEHEHILSFHCILRCGRETSA